MVVHSQIWGNVELYALLKSNKQIQFEAYEHYQKRSTRNRYNIAAANGLQTLSIPLKKGKNNQTRITDVLISYDENWVNKHLTAIQSAYGKSAYFEHYYPFIEALYLTKPSNLYNLNRQTIELINRFLQIDYPFTQTTEYKGLSIKSYESFVPKSYQQVFEYKNGFISRTCILDLLFCMGPEAIFYL